MTTPNHPPEWRAGPSQPRSDLTLRGATLADCVRIAEIYGQAVRSGRSTMDTGETSVSNVARDLSRLSEREGMLVALEGDRVVGWASVRRYSERSGYVQVAETSVYVDESAQGRGIGSALRDATTARAMQLGYRHLVAKILAVNDASVRFHQRGGYEVVGRQRRIGLLKGVWHDVVILQHLLPDSGRPQPERPAATQVAPSDPLRTLISELDTRTPETPEAAAELLAWVDLDAAALEPWSDFRHPLRESYGRRLLHRGERYELMVMSWLPGDYSAIHDHGIARWGAVRYLGEAEHVRFEQTGGVLSLAQRDITPIGSVCAVHHDLVHLMGNPGSVPFLSLHLYGAPEPCANVTADARIFELFERRIQRTHGGVFYALPEEEIVRREPCPEADRPSHRLHHHLLLQRLGRILAAGEGDEALARRADEVRRAVAALGEAGGR
jgi:L-amino acid N-acyltransferase YncA/predicted metal-dependent enzyme (double-stranded beta helix superfamily)